MPTDTLEELAVSSYYDAATSIFSLVAGCLIIFIVGQVTARQMDFLHGRN